MSYEVLVDSKIHKVDTHDFTLDHFGVVASPLIQQLINQSSDRRSRKSALGNLTRIAKATKQIPRNCQVLFCGLSVNHGGEIFLSFTVTSEEEHASKNPVQTRG